MAKKKVAKKEALTTRLFITEILENTLGIPTRNIVNDTTFEKYTGSKRPDLLISQTAYNGTNDNDFINNLVAYAEAKDESCVIDDIHWKDAIKQGLDKSKKLNIPYFIVTNLKTSKYYNSQNGEIITLNGNELREFLNLDLLNYIKKFLQKNPKENNITTNADTSSVISEDVFNKKLWELANIYRNISFKNSSEKIDFSIGFIVLKYFEEKTKTLNESINENMQYWSGIKKTLDLVDFAENEKQAKNKFINDLIQEFEALKEDAQFKEMSQIIKTVIDIIKTKDGNGYINQDNVIDVFKVVDDMGALHASGFDLFGSIYEKFASKEEKQAFGEFFTRRHYTHVFSKLLIKDKLFSLNKDTNWKILDPACGTGGFLTEIFKIIQREISLKYQTINKESQESKELEQIRNSLLDNLKRNFIFGFDIKEENVARTKLNMFLVGDGHTNIVRKNSLKEIKIYNLIERQEGNKKITEKKFVLKESDKFDVILTNPPYGDGTDVADTSVMNTSRYELAFIVKIIHLLKIGGQACLIIPDGFFENPSYSKLRKELLETCTVDAVISLPKHAFAPYTGEKTYALYITRKNHVENKIKQEPIWMYIIDNDGYANSNKRFPTKLKGEKGEWLHDEISSYISKNGDEEIGLLEKRWKKYDDSKNPTCYINEKGEWLTIRKAGFIEVNNIDGVCEDNYWNLLPEFYLRPYEPNYITYEDFESEAKKILGEI